MSDFVLALTAGSLFAAVIIAAEVILAKVPYLDYIDRIWE